MTYIDPDFVFGIIVTCKSWNSPEFLLVFSGSLSKLQKEIFIHKENLPNTEVNASVEKLLFKILIFFNGAFTNVAIIIIIIRCICVYI